MHKTLLSVVLGGMTKHLYYGKILMGGVTPWVLIANTHF